VSPRGPGLNRPQAERGGAAHLPEHTGQPPRDRHPGGTGLPASSSEWGQGARHGAPPTSSVPHGMDLCDPSWVTMATGSHLQRGRQWTALATVVRTHPSGSCPSRHEILVTGVEPTGEDQRVTAGRKLQGPRLSCYSRARSELFFSDPRRSRFLRWPRELLSCHTVTQHAAPVQGQGLAKAPRAGREAKGSKEDGRLSDSGDTTTLARSSVRRRSAQEVQCCRGLGTDAPRARPRSSPCL
jgi:hypothetical protein